MWTIQSDKRFYLLSVVLLVAIFAITLIQNIIRYSGHSSYNIWVSIFYLCVSVLLFIPFIILIVQIEKWIKSNYPKWYWALFLPLAAVGLFTFYLISNLVLHSFGYFDHYVDLEYARYYFGREALYHLLLILGSAVYVFTSKKKIQTIEVNKGRKVITLAVEQVHWIEADGHYLNFYTDSEVFIKRERLGVLTKQLEPDFIRIHRKFAVNKSQIQSKEKDKRNEYVILNSGKKLKIGQSFKPIIW
ncbi:LytR/AlgR family response regulator transcription factor [Flagellimonas sp.]|uniref:LytR/AlgR family response regulator transcription factor n=1 Tax=Flagellimonas sp. TaxID=2058762 RepID=UPI003B5CFE12